MSGTAEPVGHPESESGDEGEGRAGARYEQHAEATGGSTIVQALGDIHQHLPDTPPPPAAMRTLVLDVPDFTGRDTELARLLTGASGVVAVHAVNGMAGVGKTALIRRAASLLVNRFPDGQLFVDLHAHTPGQAPADPAAVLASLLDKTGLDPRHLPTALEDRAARWRDRVAGRRVLLVLDDAASPDQVRPLLPGPGRCLVLITSRRRLDVEEAEHLALPILPADQAVELFVRICRRTPAPDQRPVIEEIVRRCGFLPLAVVLLARRLVHRPAWTIAYLADTFTAAADRLAELRAGNRPGDAAVAAAFEMSYRDLTPEQRRLFRLLSLHPGPDVDGHAAAALAGIPLAQARDDLDALYLDHLLIEAPASPGRYELHDLLRVYARALADRHDGEPERDQAVDRLLDHYRRTARTAGHHLSTYTRPETSPAAESGTAAGPDVSDRATALSWMRTERANLLACIEHATGHDLYGYASGLTAALAAFLQLEGPWPQAVALHQAAAVAAHHGHDRLGEANALNDLGFIHQLSGDYPAAAELLERALTVYREIGNRMGEANTLNNLGRAHYLTGDYPAAAELLERALAISQEIGDPLGEANILNGLGRGRYLTGDYPAAAELLGRALTVYREIGDPLGEANTLNDLGRTHYLSGDFPAATTLLERTLAISQEIGNRVGEADTLNDLGFVRYLSGDFSAAAALLGRALAIYREIGDRPGEAVVLNSLGFNRQMAGDYPAAAELLEQALAISQEIGNRLGEANALNDLGRTRYLSGDHPAAAELLGRALTVYREIGDPLGEANALNDLGRTHYLTGDHRAAAELLERALSLFRQVGDSQGEAQVLNNMGAVTADSTGPQDALPLYEQALRLARQMSSQLDEAHALEGIARCVALVGDREAAITHLRQAVEIYRRLASPEAEAAATYLATLETE